MDLANINQIEKATRFGRKETFRLGVALLFVVGVMLYTYLSMHNTPGSLMLVIAAMMGGYMALNIGANDVANNVGPAVGSQALTTDGGDPDCSHI